MLLNSKDPSPIYIPTNECPAPTGFARFALVTSSVRIPTVSLKYACPAALIRNLSISAELSVAITKSDTSLP